MNFPWTEPGLRPLQRMLHVAPEPRFRLLRLFFFFSAFSAYLLVADARGFNSVDIARQGQWRGGLSCQTNVHVCIHQN